MNRPLTAITTTVLALQLGCGAIQQPSWNKPVGKGTWIPAAVCTLLGAGAGIGVQEARRGCNTLPDGTDIECDDRNYWQGALIGAAIGAVVCGVAGHVFLDPTPPYPPVAPPPPATPTPEPVVEVEEVVVPAVTRRIVLRGINFDFDSSEIRADSAPVLDEAVNQLAANPDVAIVVVGHTDSIGSAEYNQRLSVLRAEAVYRYLVNRGIAPERMTVKGMGKTSPVADNGTADGRALNRRVELTVSNGNGD